MFDDFLFLFVLNIYLNLFEVVWFSKYVIVIYVFIILIIGFKKNKLEFFYYESVKSGKF